MSLSSRFRDLLRAALAVLALVLTAGISPAEPPSRPPGRRCALLVGVSQYDDRLPELRYPDHDVETLRDVLVSHGYSPEDVQLLTSRQGRKDPRQSPDRRNIIAALDRLLRGRSPADSVLLAFAGHGVQFTDDAESYFCPADADLTRRDTLLPLTEVYSRLKECPAGVRVIAVDACRKDPAADTSRGANEVHLRSRTRPQRQAPPGGVAVLFSCSEGQEAFEDKDLQHGIFFHFLIEGLKGEAAGSDRQIRLSTLYDYLAERVDDFAWRKMHCSQRPCLIGEYSGPMSLVALAPTAPGQGPVPPLAAAEPGGEVLRLAGHRRTVSGVAFFADGRHALSGSFDGTLRMWNVETGAELACLQSPDAGWVRCVAVSADGRFAISGGENQVVRVWDLAVEREVKQLRGHTGAVRSVAIAPDGRFALSGGDDRTVRLWDLATGEEVRQFRGHAAAVRSVAFAADGRLALSGGADRTVRLWDVDAGTEERRFEGHEDAVLSVSLSRDGRRAVSGGTDRTMRLWDVSTGKQLRCFRGDMDRVLAVAVSPDGRRALCAGTDKVLRLWDLETGRLLGSLHGHETNVWSLAFSPDGTQALSGAGALDDQDDAVRLWKLPSS
jgi:WD40 repeat protein